MAIELDVDGLVIGTYNFTIVARDQSSNLALDMVIVEVTEVSDAPTDDPTDGPTDEDDDNFRLIIIGIIGAIVVLGGIIVINLFKTKEEN